VIVATLGGWAPVWVPNQYFFFNFSDEKPGFSSENQKGILSAAENREIDFYTTNNFELLVFGKKKIRLEDVFCDCRPVF